MFEVKNARDYRAAYDLLAWIEENRAKALAEQAWDRADELHKREVELKRNMRAWASKDSLVDVGMGFMCERVLVKNSFDYCIERVSVPDVFTTARDVEEFFLAFLDRGSCPPSMYDCTGRIFTVWHKAFKRNGRWWIYHETAIDV